MSIKQRIIEPKNSNVSELQFTVASISRIFKKIWFTKIDFKSAISISVFSTYVITCMYPYTFS